MPVFSRFEVRPVGQGAFVRGSEQIGPTPHYFREPTVRWIYDCGTDAGKAVINASITDLGVTWPPYHITGDPLDILAISHFDKDHISGLPLLLARYHFVRIFMPQVPRMVRLLAGLRNLEDTDISLAADLLWFLDDPVGYISEHSPGGQTVVVLVEPAEDPEDRQTWDEANPDEGEMDPPEVDDPSHPAGNEIISTIVPPSGGRQSNGKVVINTSKSGAPFVWRGEWELVPYIDKEAKDTFLTFDSDAQKKLDDQLKELRDLAQEVARTATVTQKEVSAIKRGITELRDAIYNKMADAAGKKAIDSLTKNAISLMIYTGPVRIKSAYTEVLVGAEAPTGKATYFDLAEFGAARSGVLLTGDADLSANDKVDRLRSFMTPGRISTIGVFQVPHHGSSKNSTGYAARALGAPFNVINANPHARHKHPDAVVVNAFKSSSSMKGALSLANVALANSRSFETIAFTWDNSAPPEWPACWRRRYWPSW